MKAWQGPSLIDGRPIMLCLSSLTTPRTNRKLGDMVQAWIIPVDEPPQVAVKTGLDASVCGDCLRRFSVRFARPESAGRQPDEVACPGDCRRCTLCEPGDGRNVYQVEHGTPGRCYVIPWQVPKLMHEVHGLKEPDLEGARIAIVKARKRVRISAYGDPTAIPLSVWDELVPWSRWGPTYTRRWRVSREWAGRAMASVESVAEADEAHEQGWRTYRVGARG